MAATSPSTQCDIQKRLQLKQEVVYAVIDARIQAHHELLDKWKERWKTTVAESIDEKREKLTKQQAIFRGRRACLDVTVDLRRDSSAK
jgi:hypothetical protein